MSFALPARSFSPRVPLLVLALATCSAVQAGLIDSGVGLDTPASQTVNVYCDPSDPSTLLGTLNINTYFAWTSGVDSGSGIPYSPENPGLPTTGVQWENRAGGAIVANFTPGDTDCSPQFEWVQAVVGGTGTIGTPPYLDPFNRDDNLPFYWTAAENSDPSIGNNGMTFSDIPGQAATNIGNSIEFETALVEFDPHTLEMHWVAGFTWGYSINDIVGPVMDNFAWTNGPSNTLVNLVDSWSSSPTSPYIGNGTPDGYSFTSDCLCNVPEVGSGLLSFAGVGMVGLGLITVRRRRMAV